jgi:outer membrane protein insertion porin family
VQWLAPLGLFRFSYGIPLNSFSGNTVTFGDQTERSNFLSVKRFDLSSI